MSKYDDYLANNPPGAIFFDWDNTLADTDDIIKEVGRRMLAEKGIHNVDLDKMLIAWRKSKDDYYQTSFPDDTIEAIDAMFFRHFSEIHIDLIKLMPGARQVLEEASKKGITLVIVSNKPEDLLLLEIAEMGATKYFEIIVGGVKGQELKPSPDPIVRAIKALHKKCDNEKRPGIEVGNIWFVGDDIADADAARSDGLQRIVFGAESRQIVKDRFIGDDPAGEIIYINGMHELLEMIKKLPGKSSDKSL